MQLPKLLELVGLGYTVWFTYRYLLFKVRRCSAPCTPLSMMLSDANRLQFLVRQRQPREAVVPVCVVSAFCTVLINVNPLQTGWLLRC